MTSTEEKYDLVVVGAGAAGLFAAIFAGRAGQRVLVLDGAKKLGAKILVAGGGRCNVTHHSVDPKDYAGGTPNAIRKVLRRFTVEDTIAFFADQAGDLKREDTGKLFPVTDKARTILDALLNACRNANVVIRHPQRVESILPITDGYSINGEWGTIRSQRIILATGGQALPKSGSDGHGYKMAQSLGHSITERIFPALVPLILPGEHPLRSLSGLSFEATLMVKNQSGKLLHQTTHSILCTHFGLSGPGILDVSRYWRDAHENDNHSSLLLNFFPHVPEEEIVNALLHGGTKSPRNILRKWHGDRLVETILHLAGVDATGSCAQLTKKDRKSLTQTCCALNLPIQGDRGFTYAEVTMGGIPLEEVQLKTMESRVSPGLHLVGEILDVDGRIGGFNFQWAWATGFIAGTKQVERKTIS